MRLFTTILALIAGMLLLTTFSGCDEDGELEITLFAFDWKTQNPAMSLESIHSQLENPPSTLTAGAIEYSNLRPDPLNLVSNRINVYGSPPSNLDIYITRDPSNDELNVKAIKINVLGTLHEGQTYTNDDSPENYVELYFGDGLGNNRVTYSTNVGSDTYFELTIDRLDTNTRRIGGTFYCALRSEDDPDGDDAIIGFNGNFDWIY